MTGSSRHCRSWPDSSVSTGDLNEVCAEVEPYPQVLINIRLDAQRDIVGLPAVQDALRTAEQALAGRGRILLRPSGTEPLVRVMVEGVDADEVGRLAEWLSDVVRAQMAPSSAEQIP